jgi:hypothetical protein
MTLLEAALILADKYQAAHSKCDIYLTDTECYAEQYGDGNAGEHEDFRDLEIAIDDAALIAAAPETAAERDRLRESNGAMLAALTDLMPLLDAVEASLGDDSDEDHLRIEQARAALAAAGRIRR